MKFLLTLCLIGFSGIPIFSQPPTGTAEENYRKAREDKMLKKGVTPIDQLISDSQKSSVPTKSYQRVRLIPTDEQLKILAPATEDLTKYSAFLTLPKTGLVKLFPNYDCAKFKFTVPASNPCIDEIPMSGFYSFRKRKYSPQMLADLEFKDGKFLTNGKLANGMMVSLGDIPLERVKLEDVGMQLLVEFPPARNQNEVSAKSFQLKQGIRVWDYLYSTEIVARKNNTYAIRVIAYHGKDLPFYPNYYPEEDKRYDITVVFRVIREDADGSLTLLWKELERKESPKIKIS